MSLYRINVTPSTTLCSWTQETTLEGVDYVLAFNYNQSEDCYYLSIADANATDGSFLVPSMKLITGKALLRRWNGAATPWPPGEMWPISTSADTSVAKLGELGSRIILLYATSDDPGLA